MTPISYFNDVWARCDELEALHSYLVGKLTPALSADELLRAEWVARVSALDLYVHEIIAQRMVQIFEGTRSSCSGFFRFSCSTETLIRIKSSLSTAESNSAFDLEVRNKIGRLTYQYPDDIADGIRFVSSCELWNEIALFYGATEKTKSVQAKEMKKKLSLIVERRNKIAHEADLQPQIPRLPWPIRRADLSYVADIIGNIVKAIETIL